MTARIGLIIPSSNRMVEQEMVRHVPPGVTAHIMRLRMTGAYNVPPDQLLPRVKEAAGTLVDARCDVIAFHCTANSMADGMEGEAKLLAAVKSAGAPHATTTATAIRRAFDALGAHRIVLLTPYSAHTTEEEAEFLHKAGYEVIYAHGFAFKGSDEYCATPPQFWRDRALEAQRPNADAYNNLGYTYILMHRFPEAISALQEALKLNSRESMIWGNLGDALYWSPARRGEAIKQYEQAIAICRNSLQVNPKDFESLIYGANYLAMINDRKTALAYLKQALALAPTNGEVLLRAAVIYHHLGLQSETMDSLRKAVKAGYSKTVIRDTPDFQDLRSDPSFTTLVG